MSTLWLLLAPVCAAAYTLLLPLAPNDFWYNARAGAYIVQNAHIPTTALFTSSVPADTPYLYQSWLAQIALFQALENVGLSGLIILRSVTVTFCFGLLLWAAWRRGKRIAPHLPDTTLARAVAASTLLAFGLAASNMDVRPQLFSFPIFCVFVFALWEWPFLETRRRALAAGVLVFLMMIWANTHGAFVTGLVLVTAFTAGEFLTKSSTKKAALLLLVSCSVVTLLNPRGIGIYGYVWQLAQLEANQKFIQEWQAPRLTDWYGALLFFVMFLLALLAGVLALRSKAQPTPLSPTPVAAMGVRLPEVLMLLAMVVMALRDVRSIIWFAFLAAPLLAALSTRLLAHDAKTTEPESVPRAAQFINGVLALLLIGSVVPLLPQNKAGLPLPPEYRSHFATTPRGTFPVGFGNEPHFLVEKLTPVRAVEWLRENPPRKNIWNDFVYGSYLAWATLYEPRLAPHADPRVEMRSLEFWEEYGRIAGGAPDAPSTLRAQGFSDAVLNVEEQKKLIAVLKAAGWRETLRSGGAVVLRSDN